MSARAFAFSIGCFVLLLSAPGAFAEEWHFTPFVGYTFKGATSGFVDPEAASDKLHRHFGGAVNLITGGTMGVEALFVDAPHFFKRDDLQRVSESSSFGLMGNVIVTAPRRWTEYTLRPFVSGGLGLLHVTVVDKDRFFDPVRANVAGFNAGGGAIGFLTKRTGVRFEIRYFSTLRPPVTPPLSVSGVRVRYMTASIGLVIRP
jgi:hypothetical protein